VPPTDSAKKQFFTKNLKEKKFFFELILFALFHGGESPKPRKL
jgi:hypothetical protein